MDLSRFNSGGGDFELAPSGVHNAVCIAVIDLGTQKGEYMGKPKTAPKLLLRWEIDEQMEDGRRFMIQKRYTASMHEKASLRKHLEAWRGQPFKDSDLAEGGFSMEKLLGAGCQLQILHHEREGKMYANIESIMKLGKGMKALKPEIVPFLFDLQAFDAALFESFSEGLKKTISEAPEYAAARAKLNGKAANGKPAVAPVKDEHDAAWEPPAAELTDDFDDPVPF